MSSSLVLAPLVLLSFALRIAIHLGRTPGGVDTWYYMAYADAFARQPGLEVRLPQYLLQDERQSYPPLFPSLLGLVPRRLRRRGYWLISPLLDAFHVAALMAFVLTTTGSVGAALVSGGVFALTPLLIAEARSLSGRAFASLSFSLAMLALLAAVGSGSWWVAAALLSATAVVLASGSMSAAYGFVSLVMTLVTGSPAYLACFVGALVLALFATGGHYGRVVVNYWHAVVYWWRNRARYGGHPIRNSPIYGRANGAAAKPGFLGGNRLQQLARLLGENPFLLALPFVSDQGSASGHFAYWWATSLAVLVVLATLVPLLGAFGPSRGYMRATIVPTAYLLGLETTRPGWSAHPLAWATLLAGFGSCCAIGFFYWYARRRRTGQTTSAPEGLQRAAQRLGELPGGALFCLPTVYTDYACYHSGHPVLWGGHCGNLHRLEAIAPVVTRPLDQLFREYDVRYVLLETDYVGREELGLGDRLRPLSEYGTLTLYEYSPT